MFFRIGLKGLEEGRGCVYEEHALPPACRHRGRERGGGQEGEKGVEGGKVAVRALSVGSDAFLLVRLPHPCKRASTSLHISKIHFTLQIRY